MTDHFADAGKPMPTLELAELLEQNALMPLDDVAAAELRHLHNEVRVLAETLQRCKEVGNFTAECYRLDLERDEVLLRQALEALNHVNVQDRLKIIAALRERLGETK